MHYNLGNTLGELGRAEEAVDAYRAAGGDVPQRDGPVVPRGDERPPVGGEEQRDDHAPVARHRRGGAAGGQPPSRKAVRVTAAVLRRASAMNQLPVDSLERSAVVSNCRMNRERRLAGSNGYARELGLHPLDFLTGRLANRERVAWLDLCCGTGRALVEAAERLGAAGLAARDEILGVDLAGLFDRLPAGLIWLRLVEASVSRWRPERAYDLVTSVHGLHYVGDKLGLISRAAAWLTGDGRFVANLDLANVKSASGGAAGRVFAAELRRCGLEYARQRRVVGHGRREVRLPFRYLGADDAAGPNSTGQPAVDSYYEPSPVPPGRRP